MPRVLMGAGLAWPFFLPQGPQRSPGSGPARRAAASAVRSSLDRRDGPVPCAGHPQVVRGGAAATAGPGPDRGHAARPGRGPVSKVTGGIIPVDDCLRVVLYSSIRAATLILAPALAAKCSPESSSNSSVEWNDSMAALSSADPGLPTGWRIPRQLAGLAEGPRGVLAALIGVHDDPGDVPAADRRRHRQRPYARSAS